MKVLGIGNALVDIMTILPGDSILETLDLPKGSMQLVNKEISQLVQQKTQGFERSICSGGSAANTIHGLAMLNLPCGFIGKIGPDQMGEIFDQHLRESGVNTCLLKSQNDSGVAVALVSPDGERTFATFLGAAVELSANDLKEEYFEGYQILHVEGYLMQNYDLINRAIEIAKSKGMKISFDLASYNVVEDHRQFVNKILRDSCDIVFANEEEAKVLTGLDPADAIKDISQYVQTAIVKAGSKGSYVFMNNEFTFIPSRSVDVVDTTGAGDLYASGFLYGYCQDWSAEKSIQLATHMAAEVIQHVGAKIPDLKWAGIKNEHI